MNNAGENFVVPKLQWCHTWEDAKRLIYRTTLSFISFSLMAKTLFSFFSFVRLRDESSRAIWLNDVIIGPRGNVFPIQAQHSPCPSVGVACSNIFGRIRRLINWWSYHIIDYLLILIILHIITVHIPPHGRTAENFGKLLCAYFVALSLSPRDHNNSLLFTDIYSFHLKQKEVERIRRRWWWGWGEKFL